MPPPKIPSVQARAWRKEGVGGRNSAPSEHRIEPATLPEYLEGRTPKENTLSLFRKNFIPAKSEKQGVFFSGLPPSPRGGVSGLVSILLEVSPNFLV